jgi:2-iminobutanoate/2-iminopropanoate deaminase
MVTPIPTPSVPPNNTTYSQAARLGNLIFLSGQLGLDPSTGQPLPDIESQTRQAIENIIQVLADAGTTIANVAKVNIFITDFTLLPRMNSVYSQYFTHRPAKTTVEITRLDRGALIEIEVVAGV